MAKASNKTKPDDEATQPPEVEPATTTLDENVTKPATTAPGDAPADTTDPDERAQSVTPDPGKEALKAGTVNAVKPAPPRPRAKSTAKARTESYMAFRPDGKEVKVTRNIETGESSLEA